jgi:hypothetical protein
MSVAMLSSLSVNFTVFNAPVPPASSADRSARPVEQQDDDRPRFRENTLVNAMMAAFRSLGIGPAAAPTTTAGSSPPAASGTSSVAAGDPTTNASGAGSTTRTSSTATSTAPAPDTLESAVNEFAHALSVMLHRHGRGEHADGQHDGENTHGHEGRGAGGYNGLVQRLEQLAQSLGAGTPTSTGSATSTGTASTSASASSVTTTGTSAPSTEPVPTLPSRSLTRLLAAFSNVLNILQPPTAASATETAPATAPATDTAASMTDKLKLFLTTLAQSLLTGPQVSPVGSRVNFTV